MSDVITSFIGDSLNEEDHFRKHNLLFVCVTVQWMSLLA